ncbi:MAG TPA: hypothetical protein VFH27_05580, partial [Longimicrobiaceae bacterium]|nr:hypothetical protein [Longimicrobiaceae bacterium]
MNRRSRLTRLAAWTAAGLATGILLALVAVALLSSTGWGHQKILGVTLRALGKSVNGKLHVRSVEGNLLRGARLHGVALRDTQGRAFVVADSAYLEYDVRTLLSPRIAIRNLVLYNPDIRVMRMPGDSMWNYEAIFADTTHGPKQEGADRVTTLDRVRLVNARARVEMPWVPTPGLSPRAQRAQIAEALSDTSLLLVHRVPGGMVRTMNFTAMNGRLSAIRFAPGTRAGSFFRIDSLGGQMQIFRGVTRVTNMAGRLSLLPSRMEFDAPTLDMPHSHFSAAGTVRFPPQKGADQIYDVTFDGKRVAFADLTWLYPRMPRNATGRLLFDMETHPDGVLYRAREAVLDAPGTHVTGSFGMVVGDTVRFTDVNLRANPLRMATIEAMLPSQLPVVGLHIGSAVVRGSGVRAP